MRLADDISAIPEGWVIRSRSMPLVWALNHVRLRQPVEFREAVELADLHLRDRPYRRVEVEDEAQGARLESEFRAGGWRVERTVTMVHNREPDRDVDTAAVFEAPGNAVLELFTRWLREDWGEDPGAEPQLAEHWRRQWQLRNATLLGVRGRSGELAATTSLFSDGTIAQVEDVYTVPDERGQGFARSLVTRALQLAADRGHELTFIIADDHGWPQALYRRLGFDPVGRTWTFHREGGA